MLKTCPIFFRHFYLIRMRNVLYNEATSKKFIFLKEIKIMGRYTKADIELVEIIIEVIDWFTETQKGVIEWYEEVQATGSDDEKQEFEVILNQMYQLQNQIHELYMDTLTEDLSIDEFIPANKLLDYVINA